MTEVSWEADVEELPSRAELVRVQAAIEFSEVPSLVAN